MIILQQIVKITIIIIIIIIIMMKNIVLIKNPVFQILLRLSLVSLEF